MTSMILLFLVTGIFFIALTGGLIVVHVCEDNNNNIDCVNGMISIHSARYGRYDRVTCPHRSINNVECGENVTEKIRSYCDEHTRCQLISSHIYFEVHDPCPGTYKYLEVNYTCMMDETTTKALTTTTRTSTSIMTTTPTTTTELTTTPSKNTETSITPQTSEMTTAIAIVVTANTSCTCFCKRTNQTCPEGDRACLIELLKRELLLKTSTLSSYKRTKISAYDGRTSSAVIGMSGVIIIGTAISLIVIPDLIVFLKFIYTKYRKKTKRCLV